jgi:hypothetical protein
MEAQRRWGGLALVLCGLMVAGPSKAVTASGIPSLVDAYATQLGASCHRPEKGAALVAAVAQRADLNGDHVDEWIIDAGRACPHTDGPAVKYGSQVTVFSAAEKGEAVPSFQQAAFSSHIEHAAGKVRLILTVGGAMCGEGPESQRCDRPVVWNALTKRFELAPVAPKPAKRPDSQGGATKSRR